MQKPIAKPTSLLVIDVSPVEVHAHLIKQIDEFYHWMGVGKAPVALTMLGNIDKRCVLNALHQLTTHTSCILLGDDNQVITPTDIHGRGVDRICITWSLTTPLKVVLIGLMPSYSLNVGHRLIAEMPMEIIDQIASTDDRSVDERMDTILTSGAELIVLLGGVDGGADQVIKTQVDLIVRSLSILPQDLRPEVVYAGNSTLSGYVKSKLEGLTVISTAANIQPTLMDTDLQPAREVLANVCSRIWLKRFNLQTGASQLNVDFTRPTINAIEDLVNILAKCENANNGCVAIYLNSLSTSISAILDDRGTSHQYAKTCRTYGSNTSVRDIKLVDVTSWSPSKIQQIDLVDHLIGDALYPGRLPVTSTDSAIDQGVTHTAGRLTWHQLTKKRDFDSRLISKQDGLDADLILIGGSKLYSRQSLGPVLLEIMDILQPIGITDVYLDREGVAAPLGALAHIDPIIPVHCILGNALLKLATVIAPAFHAKDNSKVMTLVMVNTEGKKIVHEIQSGSLFSIPLAVDETIEMRIPFRLGVDLGLRSSRRKTFTLTGSAMGIIVDARGRPLIPRKDPQAQQAWMKRSLEQAQELDK